MTIIGTLAKVRAIPTRIGQVMRTLAGPVISDRDMWCAACGCGTWECDQSRLADL